MIAMLAFVSFLPNMIQINFLFHESLVNSKIEFMSQYKNWADFLLLIFLEQHLLFQRNILQWTTVCEQSKWICSQVFTLNSNLSTAAH